MSALEKIINSEKIEKIRNSAVYRYAVDTATHIVISTPFAIANEVFIVDMELEESLKVRGVAILTNLVTARPFGKYRDYVFKRCKTTTESGFIKTALTDILAFGTFQAPFYAGILAASGANAEQILAGAAILTGVSGFVGRPYGAILDTARRLAGLKPAYVLAQESQKKD